VVLIQPHSTNGLIRAQIFSRDGFRTLTKFRITLQQNQEASVRKNMQSQNQNGHLRCDFIGEAISLVVSISRDVQPEAPSKELKKTEKNESKSKSELIENDINNGIYKEPQRNSNLNQDKPSESLCKKRNLSSSPSCAEKASWAEKASELKSAQKSTRRKMKKKKKKKKGSIIKRLFQRLKWKSEMN